MFEDRLMIRLAGPDDEATLRHLADVDSQPYLHGSALIAEVDGTAVVAISLAAGHVVANPFRHTAELVRLLELEREARQPAKPGAAGPWAGVRRALRPARLLQDAA